MELFTSLMDLGTIFGGTGNDPRSEKLTADPLPGPYSRERTKQQDLSSSLKEMTMFDELRILVTLTDNDLGAIIGGGNGDQGGFPEGEEEPDPPSP